MSNNQPPRSKKDRASRAEQMRRERDKADRRQRNVISVVIVVIVAALIGTAAWAINNESGEPAQAYVEPAHTNSDFGIVWDREASTGKPTPADAVPITIYEDFQCPACQAFEAADGAFLQDAVDKGDITIEYRPIAFLDSSRTDEYSSRAMNSALCVLDAKGVKAFHDMHNLLFANQSPESGPGNKDSVLVGLAEQVGATKVKSCIEDRTYEPYIRKATDAAREAGVSATPTVLIDGKDVHGAKANTLPKVEDLKKAIAAARKG